MLADSRCVAIESAHPSPLSASRDSSDRGRSAAPTNYWPGWAPTWWTGACPEARRTASAAGDLAGLPADGAQCVDPPLVAARTGHGMHGLDVRIPPAVGPPMQCDTDLPNPGPFPHTSHTAAMSETPQIQVGWGRLSRSGAGEPPRPVTRNPVRIPAARAERQNAPAQPVVGHDPSPPLARLTPRRWWRAEVSMAERRLTGPSWGPGRTPPWATSSGTPTRSTH